MSSTKTIVKKKNEDNIIKSRARPKTLAKLATIKKTVTPVKKVTVVAKSTVVPKAKIIPKSKSVSKVKLKDNPNNLKNNEDKTESHEKKEVEYPKTDEFIKECIGVIMETDPDQKCSKEELIEKIEDQLFVAHKKIEGNNFKPIKVLAMEKVLSDLKIEQMKNNLVNLDKTRVEQDKIILKNKVEEKYFKQKIDLTAPKKKDDVDLQYKIFSESKKFWEVESKKVRKPPKDKEIIFKKTRGNRKLPKEMATQIYGK